MLIGRSRSAGARCRARYSLRMYAAFDPLFLPMGLGRLVGALSARREPVTGPVDDDLCGRRRHFLARVEREVAGRDLRRCAAARQRAREAHVAIELDDVAPWQDRAGVGLRTPEAAVVTAVAQRGAGQRDRRVVRRLLDPQGLEPVAGPSVVARLDDLRIAGRIAGIGLVRPVRDGRFRCGRGAAEQQDGADHREGGHPDQPA